MHRHLCFFLLLVASMDSRALPCAPENLTEMASMVSLLLPSHRSAVLWEDRRGELLPFLKCIAHTGDCESSQFAQLLIRGLMHPDTEVQALAMSGLGRIKTPSREVFAALHDYHAPDPTMSRALSNIYATLRLRNRSCAIAVEHWRTR